jgi:geranylgeranyl diphosphate synthase type II
MKIDQSNENFAELRQYVEKFRPQIEKSLREHLPPAPPKIETEFIEAVEYALFSNEKRIRPILTLLGAELFGAKAESVLPSAAAVEFIYTSSLIFDDLPCMNNAEKKKKKKKKLRHAEISLHEKYGESSAILVAVGLLNASYPLVFTNHIGMPERAMQAHAEIVECVGAAGIIGGQAANLKPTKKAHAADFAGSYHSPSGENLSASALMRLSLRIGAILAGADYLDLANLSRFAELLGDAYLISEDEDEIYMVSPANVSSQNHLNNLVEQAKRFLIENFPSNEARSCLIQLTEYLAERK